MDQIHHLKDAIQSFSDQQFFYLMVIKLDLYLSFLLIIK